jgi:hypothetical protein
MKFKSGVVKVIKMIQWRYIKLNKNGITLLLFIAIIIISYSVSADVVEVELTTTGQIVPKEESPIYMQSQNITAYLNEKVHEITEYTLKNPTNSTINTTSLLPFSVDRAYVIEVPKPRNLILTINGIETDYDWTIFEWENQEFDAIIFYLSFEPFEQIIVIAEYDRYWSKSNAWEYEYLTLTGTLWNHPIEYAKFEYFIPDDVSSYRIKGMDNYQVGRGENNTHIIKEFYNWIPNENIKIEISNPRDYKPPSALNPFGSRSDNSFMLSFLLPIVIVIGIFLAIIILIIYFKNRRRKQSQYALQHQFPPQQQYPQQPPPYYK